MKWLRTAFVLQSLVVLCCAVSLVLNVIENDAGLAVMMAFFFIANIFFARETVRSAAKIRRESP